MGLPQAEDVAAHQRQLVYIRAKSLAIDSEARGTEEQRAVREEGRPASAPARGDTSGRTAASVKVGLGERDGGLRRSLQLGRGELRQGEAHGVALVLKRRVALLEVD